MLCSKSLSYSAVRYEMGVQYKEQTYFKIHWWTFCKIYLKFTINLYLFTLLL